MSEPKRYSDLDVWKALHFGENDSGWVKWEDYARLKAEVERLTQLNSTLALRYDATNSMLDGCAKTIEEMEAQVERLTKAGDEVIREWSSGEEKAAKNFMKALVIWNDAKEVQS